MNPLLIKNYIADAAVAAFTIVKQGAADSGVAQATASTENLLGVTTDIPAASGDRVDVILVGGANVVAGAAISAGALLTSDSSGRAVTAAPGAGVNANIIGRALESATNAGDVIRVLLGQGRIQG